MGAMMRNLDWSKTAVGPVSGWSQPLRTMVGLVLRNRFPLCMWWGPGLIQFYNDPFIPILGSKHPAACGQSGGTCWDEIWHTIGPMIEGPFSGLPATGSEDLSLLIHRNGFFEETHFRVAYSPIPDETVIETGIGGVLATVSETTAKVHAERQSRTLQELGASAHAARTAKHACEGAAVALLANPSDVPFSLFYLLEDESHARLAAGFSAEPATARPLVIDVASSDPAHSWPLATCISQRRIEVVNDVRARFGSMPTGSWAESPRSAIILPIAAPDQARPYGVLIAGLNPHRRLDEGYRAFFELAAAQVVTAIRNARAFEEEQNQVEALAKIDQAKTAFFSNVSHEFRTPLALMLGPLEDALASPARALVGEPLSMAHRNALRLLKLVNSLLDFSRMEAGRVEASFQATDLGRFTIDLSSQFRAAMEKGGLRLVVETPPHPTEAFVDREMWEKIVLNLLSNAFKHTLEGGEVRVSLSKAGDVIHLCVRDTGIGISAEELPRVFERFYRVRGAHSRSHEGTGIGLALVRNLVELHGGTIEAQSQEGVGSCFTVSIPTGSAHLPAGRIEAAKALAPTAVSSAAYVNDALSWLSVDDPDREALAISPAEGRTSADGRLPARLILADDNADMREYLRRLLSTQWTVEAVADGRLALEAVRRQRPDLIVSDVMMPNMDGLELTRELRTDPITQRLPIILLSARTGDAATAEGLASGANDYVVKPFSARELIARVTVQLEIARSHERTREQDHARLAQEHLRKMAEAASQAKDDFLAVMGHELRNPLAPILSALQLMEKRDEPGSLREREIIGRQAKHLVVLVDELLDVSRIRSGKVQLERQEIEIGEIISRATKLATPLMSQRKHRLVVEVDQPGVKVNADPVRLPQVIFNLLSNSAKFTNPGGVIVLRAATEGGSMVIRVIDPGVGIEPALLPSVFEAFAQGEQASDRAVGGLGLGLAIAKGLVELHGGQIDVHSEGHGKGCEVVVRLPLPETSDSTNPTERVVAPPPTAPGLRILVVDDNEDVASLLGELLELEGHQVVVALDGFAALEARKTFAPQVALLDIGLPGMDGCELARRLRSYEPAAPVRLIAISGYTEQKDRLRSKEAGFDVHLAKPVEMSHLLELLAMSSPT